MKKTLVAFLAIATVGGSLTTTPASAQRGVAAGIAAGLIGGAIVGGAIASSRAPVYVEGPPPAPPGCYWQRQRFWDGYGWRFRSYQVCN
jgi:hypothetical protein